MLLFKQLTLLFMIIFITSCSVSEEKKRKKVVIPEKITFLFVTQPYCPACDMLEATMALEGPNELLKNYFNVKKIYYGEKLPQGLIPPNGTPTVYFLGTDNEVLVEPMVGEKEEEGLMDYLEDALLEFKNIYHVDLIELHDKKNNEKNKKNETNITTANNLYSTKYNSL